MSRVVFAPDSFKGTIGAAAAAAALAEGWRSVDPGLEPVFRPMADGGEGTLDAFEAAVPGARRIPLMVPPPASTPDAAGVEASWLLLPPTAEAPGGTGVVELASTAGIELYGEALSPWHASTAGFGRTIAAALDAGVSRLVLAIGSSASTDGGTGMLWALGARFTGIDGSVPPAAAHLADISGVDLRALRSLPPGGAIVLGDVTNPLTGPRGAAAVFGPQKGLQPHEIDGVDAALAAFAALLPADPAAAGAGAAGGAGFALQAWGAVMRPGASAVAELIGLGDAAVGASVVVTGEGSYDGQSAAGKVPAFVAGIARGAGAGAALVAGRITDDADVSPFDDALSLVALAGSVPSALAEPRRWLVEAGAQLARRRQPASPGT